MSEVVFKLSRRDFLRRAAAAVAGVALDPRTILSREIGKRGEDEELIKTSVRLFGGRHFVKWGETLSGIGKRYGLSVDSIVRANKIKNPDSIEAASWLTLPADRNLEPTGIGIDKGNPWQIQPRRWQGEMWERELSDIPSFWWHPPDYPRLLFVHRDTSPAEELVQRGKSGTRVEIFANWKNDEPILRGEIVSKQVFPRQDFDTLDDSMIERFVFDPKLLGIATCHPEDNPEAPQRLLFTATLRRPEI